MQETLHSVPLDTDVVLTGITHPMRRRLAELGIREGVTVKVTQRTSGGGRVVDINHTRYAIDGRTARALLVRPPEEL
ncbi:MAG: FeoA family protein [Corynebacterium sp.]|nr:FeoA family protein [Corynebacterium sp.]